MDKVFLATADGVKIVGDYYSAYGRDGALLLHMMPATRESWREFALKLQRNGYHVLAIDLRGHGESEGGPSSYRNFSDQEHQNSIADVEAGVSFLESKGVDKRNLTIVGASIGANLALWYASREPLISQVVLLSAGLNYRGIVTEPFIHKLTSGKRVLFVTSEDDGENADMNRTLYGAVPEGVEKNLIVYQKAGHGTDMFGKEEPDLAETILEWLR